VGMDSATETPITARRAQTRERLITAARTVFARHGVEGASVEEICEAAGFTRGAFYSNFADRSELVLAMIQQSMQFQLAAAQRAIETMKAAGDLDPEELVAIALFALTGAGAALGTASQDVITDRAMMLYAARDADLRGPYLSFVDQTTAQVQALIADALEHAHLELTVSVEAGVALLIATHNHLQTLGLFDPRRADPALLGTVLASITRPAPEAGGR
jgi:AcrR family transcriptional regulator